ncbi:MAG: hypothetical protein ACODAD_15270, partial [Planctomycetota bacterium]
MIFRQSDSPSSTGVIERAKPPRQRSLQMPSNETRVARQFRRLTHNIVREFPPEMGGAILFT